MRAFLILNMRRLFFVVAMLLFLATTGAWIRSYVVHDRWTGWSWDCYRVDDLRNTVTLMNGEFILTRSHMLPEVFSWSYESGNFNMPEPMTVFMALPLSGSTLPRGPQTILGFEYHNDRISRLIAVPFWFPALLAGALTLNAVRILRKPLRRFHTSGCCGNCGYDLRAQLGGLAGNKCPECGTPIAAV